MTPEKALEILIRASEEALLSKRGHVEAQQATEILSNYLNERKEDEQIDN